MVDKGLENDFVGRSRLLLVDGIMELYNKVLATKRPAWLSLEAPSGWGKTRVIREFYRRLAADCQANPPYWPETIDDPLLGRKAIHPVGFQRPANSLPDYLWWGINCFARQGLPAEALSTDLWKLEDHSLFVDQAWRNRTPFLARVTPTIADQTKRAGRAAAHEVASQVVSTVAGSLAPMVGPIGQLMTWAVPFIKRRREQRRSVQTATSFTGSGAKQDIEEVATQLARLTRLGFPLILVVEDFHMADHLVISLLDHLLSLEGTLLVITTTWPTNAERIPDAAKDGPPLPSLADDHQQLLIRVRHDQRHTQGNFPDGAGLWELEREARAAILQKSVPKIEEVTQRALLDRYTNPLALELFCELTQIYKTHSHLWVDGELVLPGEEIDRLPARVADLYQTIWSHLSDADKLVLAVAHVITPANINPDYGMGERRWSRVVLRDVIEEVIPERLNKEQILARLSESSDVQGWLLIIDSYLRSFLDPVQDDVAGASGASFLSDTIVISPRTAILNQLAAAVLARAERKDRTVNTSRTILALHADGYISNDQAVAQSIKAVLDELSSHPGERSERLRLFDLFNRLERDDVDDITSWGIEDHGAALLAEGGRFEEAVAILERSVRERGEILGLDHPYTLQGLSMLWAHRGGRAHGDGARPNSGMSEAVNGLREVLAAQQGILGAGHPDTLRTRFDLATLLGLHHRFTEAVEVLRAVLGEQQSQPTAEERDVLKTRHMLGSFIGGAGDWIEAADELAAVLGRQQEVLGADHPDALHTWLDLATCVGMAGQQEEAREMLNRLLEEQQTLLPDDHPKTLIARELLQSFGG